jgi:hypothetical protein
MLELATQWAATIEIDLEIHPAGNPTLTKTE